MENFELFAEKALKESISATDAQTVITWYANPSECTFEAYFSNEIGDGGLYDGAEGHCDETLIVASEDMPEAAEIFEEVRERVVREYLDELLENSDECETISIADEEIERCLKSEEGSIFYVANGDVKIQRYLDGIGYEEYRNSESCISDSEQITVGRGEIDYPSHLEEYGYSVEEIARMMGLTVKVIAAHGDCYEATYFEPFDDDEWNKKIRTLARLTDVLKSEGQVEPCDIDDSWELDGIFCDGKQWENLGYCIEQVSIGDKDFFWVHYSAMNELNYDHDCYLVSDEAAAEDITMEWLSSWAEKNDFVEVDFDKESYELIIDDEYTKFVVDAELPDYIRRTDVQFETRDQHLYIKRCDVEQLKEELLNYELCVFVERLNEDAKEGVYYDIEAKNPCKSEIVEISEDSEPIYWAWEHLGDYKFRMWC